MRSSTAAASQFFAWRTVDGQAEEVAGLAKVGVPVAVCDKVDEGEQVEEEHCEQDEEETSLVRGCAAGSILLGFYRSIEPLRVTGVNNVGRRRVVL